MNRKSKESLKKYNLWVYLVLLLTGVLILFYSYRQHLKFIDSKKEQLQEQSQVTASVLTLTINSQVNSGFISPRRMQAALNDIVSFSSIIGIAIYDNKGEFIFGTGNFAFTKHIDSSVKDQWLENRVVIYNQLSGGILFKRPHKRKNSHRGPFPLDKRGGNPFHSKKYDKYSPPVIVFDADFHNRADSGSRAKMFKKRMQKAVKDKEILSKNELIDIFSNVMPPEDCRYIAEKLAGKQLTRKLVSSAFIEFLQNRELKFESFLALNKRELGKLAIVMPIKNFNKLVEKHFINSIVFSITCILFLIILGLLWHFFVRNADLKVSLVHSQEQSNNLKDMNMTAAGLVHETKNPLGIVRGMAQLIKSEKEVSNQTIGLAEKIIEEADRVTGRLNQFLTYSKPHNPQLEALNLEKMAIELINLLKFDCEENNVLINYNIELESIVADSSMLRQILFNLILNALHACDKNSGGVISLRAAVAGGNKAYIEIRDNGCGVPGEIADDIFRPYFTTGEQGTGLGLSIVRQFCNIQGWTIELDNNRHEKSGTVFKISEIEIEHKPMA